MTANIAVAVADPELACGELAEPACAELVEPVEWVDSGVSDEVAVQIEPLFYPRESALSAGEFFPENQLSG